METRCTAFRGNKIAQARKGFCFYDALRKPSPAKYGYVNDKKKIKK